MVTVRSLAAQLATVFLSVCTLLHPSRLLAQVYNPQMEIGAPQTIFRGTDIEHVDTTNGALQIRIPLLHLPGRGLDADVSLTWNSKLWSMDAVTDPTDGTFYYSQIDWGGEFAIGWNLGPEQIGFVPGNVMEGFTCNLFDGTGGCLQPMYGATASFYDGRRQTVATTSPNGPYQSFDGSYVRLLAAWNDGPYAPETALLKDGSTSTVVRTNLIPGYSDLYTSTRTDTNGNQIVCTVVWGRNMTPLNCTDTVGRTISVPFFATAQPTMTYTDSGGVPQQITFAYQMANLSYPWLSLDSYLCYAPPYYDVYPGCTMNGMGTSLLLTSVTLPNGLSYRFEYLTNSDGTSSGLVSKIDLPTGGYVRYTYGPGSDTTSYPYGPSGSVVASRVVSLDGTAGSEQTWTYSYSYSISNALSTQVTDPLGNVESLTFTSDGGSGGGTIPRTPTQHVYKDSAGHTLKTINYTVGYDNNTYNDPDNVYFPPSWPPRQSNGRTLSATTILGDSNQQSKITYLYGTFGNVSDEYDYDWGNGQPGALMLHEHYAYLHDSSTPYSDSHAHMLNLVTAKNVYSGSGTMIAQTTTAYDTTNIISTSGAVVQHDYTHFPPTTTTRGNPTMVSDWLNASGSWLSTTKTYNDVGNMLSVTDPLSHRISYDYTDNYYNYSPQRPTSAYATTITRPATGGVNHIEKGQYYFYSGLESASCGENYPSGTACVYGLAAPQADYVSSSYDALNRPLCQNLGDGGQTCLAYHESSLPISISSSTKITGSLSLSKATVYDGLGRAIQSQLTSDPQGTVYTDTTYDALGRLSTVSNPHRTCGLDVTSSCGLTTYGYDALDRKVSVTYPDNSVLRTAYCGTSTLVTDPTRRWRRSRTDGLGRLVEVDEPNSVTATVSTNGCPGTGEPIWVTSYTLDALGNLTNVVQNASRQRSFTFDSLSRLLCASNPENASAACPAFGAASFPAGTVTYTYDQDGNVSTKMDARGIKATNFYDGANRLVSTTYSNGDPAVSFAYDESTCLGLAMCQNIGHRTSMTDAAGSESWAYDLPEGIHREQRTTANITKATTYLLDLAGNTTQVAYPTGRVVNFTFDSANRPSTAQDASSGVTYATGFKTSPGATCENTVTCYTPQGTLYALAIGQTSSFNGLKITHVYNNLLQPQEFMATSGGGNALDLSYSYVDPSVGGNAGHVFSVTNNLHALRSLTFSYDQLNRVNAAQTTSTHATGPAKCWGEVYQYDNVSTSGGGAWGNLTSIAATTNPAYLGCSQESGLSATANASNHLAGLSYDASGNTTGDGLFTYSWNGESQLRSAGGMSYLYDGDGRRVAKVGTKLYWYGSGDEILAETNTNGATTAEYVFFAGRRIANIPAGGSPIYYVEDSLGSSRVLTTNTGVVCYDADFYPFGGERPSTTTCPQNFKFEGKERDVETSVGSGNTNGNDDFGARYYSNRLGRWLSADWSNVPTPVPYANLTNPQTLNLYAMVGDDPESFADLDGHCIPWCTAAIGAGAGFLGDIIYQKIANPGKPINMKEAIAAGVAGAFIGGTAGLASAPLTLTTLAGETTLATTGSATVLATTGGPLAASSVVLQIGLSHPEA